MKSKDIIFQLGQSVAADDAEIGDIFFHFPAVGDAVIFTGGAQLEPRLAQVSVLVNAMAKSRVA